MQGQVAAQNFSFDEITYSPELTVFKLFAPSDAKRVELRLYDGDQTTASKPLRKERMKLTADGYWTLKVKGNQEGHYYTFSVDGHEETPGVFAKAVGVNGRRGYICDLTTTNPQGWADDKRPPLASPADQVVYEMHHRDFSIARPDAMHPGKFLALTEPWAISHLTELGINAVHILPSYDYGSVDETRLDQRQYNWGYDPVNYNVPEGSYSTDPYNPLCRIREFKQMVQALHKAGIRVVLDVVYNHTYDIEHSNFQLTYPDYYYRTIDHSDGQSIMANGKYSNGSGCGNETASEKPMMRRFMTESVKHWIREYHIDGLRFDLMGCHDIETMNAIRQAVDEIDPTIFIYGEGWSAGECALPAAQLGTKANIPQMPRIAAFSDELRDALRGPFDDDTRPGWLGGADNCEESLKYGIAGAISHPQIDMTKVNYSKTAWATEPTQMMAYVSCHDDMCLTDRLRASIPTLQTPTPEATAELIRLDLLAQTAVMTSQGVPFILAGEEMLRTKQGVHNSFESPDSINHIDWSRKEHYPQVMDYYSRLVSLRKHHRAFRLGETDLVRKHLEFIDAPEHVVAFRLKDNAGGDEWHNIVVILNATATPQEVNIGSGTWIEVCCDGVIDEQGLGTIEGPDAVVSPQSALILHD